MFCLPIFTTSKSWSKSPDRSHSPPKGEPICPTCHALISWERRACRLGLLQCKAGCSNLPNHGRRVPGGSPNESWRMFCSWCVPNMIPIGSNERWRVIKSTTTCATQTPCGHTSWVNISPTWQPELQSPPYTESANQSPTLQPNSGARTPYGQGGGHHTISARDIGPMPSGDWGHNAPR